MSDVTDILAAIERGDPKATGAAPGAGRPSRTDEGAEADRAAELVEKTPPLSRRRPGAHVSG
jgi:hypothetical protein